MIHCGRWQDTLRDVEMCDAVITDPPYSAATHAGALSATGEHGVNGYAPWTEEDARAFVAHWAPRCRGWMVIHTDDQLHPILRAAMGEAGRYTFPILPVLQHQPRLSGDGPASSGHFLSVSRPRDRRFLSWGSLPGWYECGRDGSYVRGGKPLGLMRSMVRDYSRPGDLIVDPFAGGGTTILASLIEGRRVVGSELDPATHAKAIARIAKGYTPDLF